MPSGWEVIVEENLFAARVANNREADKVPETSYHITTAGSELVMRRRGGYILRGALTDLEGEQAEVFYCGPDTSAAKLDASHPMMPVGPYGGPGGQHGALRWIDHEVFESVSSPAHASMRTEASLPRSMTSFTRQFYLQPGSLTVMSQIALPDGPGDQIHPSDTFPPDADLGRHSFLEHEVQTSLGDHNYFIMAGENPEELLINGQNLDNLLGKPGAARKIMNGEPHFWQGFGYDAGGQAIVQLPGGRVIQINVGTDSQQQSASLGMLLWRRPGTPSVCLEPSLGVMEMTTQGLDQRALHLAHGAVTSAALVVKTTLIMA